MILALKVSGVNPLFLNKNSTLYFLWINQLCPLYPQIRHLEIIIECGHPNLLFCFYFVWIKGLAVYFLPNVNFMDLISLMKEFQMTYNFLRAFKQPQTSVTLFYDLWNSDDLISMILFFLKP